MKLHMETLQCKKARVDGITRMLGANMPMHGEIGLS